MNELATVPTKETALQVFSAQAGLDPYLAQIKAEIDAFVPDVSTKKGRDAVASIAHKVARSKTALDNIGKDLVAELKDVPKKIDAERKRMRDLLDQWKDDVRKPLTEWEQAEEARIQHHQTNLSKFFLSSAENSALGSLELQAMLGEVEASVVDASWEEYEAEAHRAKAQAIEILRAESSKRQAYEAELAELARLREEAAAREQADREAAIAREAAERAIREAEAKAQVERDAAAKREAESKAAAERRELELKLAAEKAEREKVEAQQREAQAAAQSEARIKAAAEAERKRIADEQAAEEKATAQREADKKHRASFNNQALQAFVSGGLSGEQAKIAVTLIAGGKIPNVKINY